MANENIWDFVVDGLFVTYIVTLLGAIAATTNTFNALLFGIFGSTVETQLSGYNYSWVPNLQSVLDKSAELLLKVSETNITVYPIGQYIIMFVLFLGSILGIFAYAMRTIRSVRRALPEVGPATVG